MSKEYVTERFRSTFTKKLRGIMKDHKVIISGGIFTSAFSNKEVNDIDCYFRSKEDLMGFLEDLDEAYNTPYVNSITDKSMSIVGVEGLPLQLIYFDYFKDLDEVFTRFDWTINMCGYDFENDLMIHHENFFSDLSQRRLQFNKNTAFPLISAFRVNKYKDRGFTISKSEMLKVLLEVTKLDLSTREEFIKHVGGMYGAEVLKNVHDLKDFSPEKAMEVVGKAMSSVRSLLETENTPADTIQHHLSNVVEVMSLESELEEGSQVNYLKVGKQGYVGEDPFDIDLLRILYPTGEIVTPVIESGFYFKWVRPTDKEAVFSSCYDGRFEYTIYEEAVGEDHGLYVMTLDKLPEHHFNNKNNVILICNVDADDFIDFEHGRDKFQVKKLIPVGAMKADQIDLLKQMPQGRVLVNTGSSYPLVPTIAPYDPNPF